MVGQARQRLAAAALVLLVLALAGCGAGPGRGDQSEALSVTKALASDWSFYRFERDERFDPGALPTEGWVDVTLPHTARIEPRIVNDQWQGDALYMRSLFADPEWAGKAVWLRFEGAMMVANVYLDGEHIFAHKGGYLPFTVDLSDRLAFGRNHTLLVHLDNRDNPLTGPKPLEILDFSMYGGLYREARLFVRDSLHITDEMLADKVGGGGIFVTYPEVSARRARIAVKTHIANTGSEARRFRVRHRLLEGEREAASAVSRQYELDVGADLEDIAEIVLEDPRLWSPRAPSLYRLLTEVFYGDHRVDARETRIGIRRLSIEPGRFSINGEEMFLRGVNRHQEYPYVGYALSPQADYRDAKLIKEAGFDYVRLSHYPHSRHFLAAADEFGLLLLDAILGWQYFNPDPEFSEHVVETCRHMIRRDRNHPSIMAWECSLNESPMPPELIESLHRSVHEEYPGDQAWSAGWTREGYDIYLQARQHRLEHYEEPDRPYVVSEYGDWEYYALNAGLNQDAWEDLEEAARTSRQLLSDGEARLLQQATNIQEAHNDNFRTPAFADGYWVMFDYNRGYADDLEASGIMSIDRVAKPAYQFFRSQRDPDEVSPLYSSGPMVAIASYWTADSSPRIRVFSNAEEVALHINGDLVERRRPDDDGMSDKLAHPPFTFSLEGFEPGVLEAVGYIEDAEVARSLVRTPGKPAGLRLALAHNGVPVVENDLVFLRAALVDEQGTVVPESGVNVAFELACDAPAGRLVGPASALTEAGVASVLLRVTDPGQTCQVTANGGGLTRSARLRFSATD